MNSLPESCALAFASEKSFHPGFFLLNLLGMRQNDERRLVEAEGYESPCK
jgi:hypothetical protein